MAIDSQNNGNVLCREILIKARKQAGDIIENARIEAASLDSRTRTEAETSRQAKLDQARSEAARRRERLLASVPIEANRAKLLHIETLLNSIRDTVRQHLLSRTGFNYRDTLTALGLDAISQMEGYRFILKVSPEDLQAYGSFLVESVTHRDGRPGLTLQAEADPSMTGGGVMIHDAEGRQEWDNRLEARFERLWPALRLQLAPGLPAAIQGETRP